MAFDTPWPTTRTMTQASLRVLVLALGVSMLGSCKASGPETPNAAARATANASATKEKPRMWMTIGERRFSVTLADTDAAKAFADRLPVTLDMAELNGNEKHADLPDALPADATPPGTIHNGDLMLYGSSTVVLFYKTFRSPYAYTRLGRVDDPDELSRLLWARNSRVVFSGK